LKKSEAITQARKRLEEFDFELKELLAEEFTTTINTQKNALQIRLNVNRIELTDRFETSVESRAPTKTQVKSFVLTLRKFENVTDPGSLPRLDGLYRSGLFSSEIGGYWEQAFSVWNQYLDRLPDIRIAYTQSKLPPTPERMATAVSCLYTNRYLFNAFMYGLQSHSQEPYRTDVRERWPRLPEFYALAYFIFLGIVVEYVNFLRFVLQINNKALEELSAIEEKQRIARNP